MRSALSSPGVPETTPEPPLGPPIPPNPPSWGTFWGSLRREDPTKWGGYHPTPPNSRDFVFIRFIFPFLFKKTQNEPGPGKGGGAQTAGGVG